MGRHRRRKTSRTSVTAARIAVGGLVLTGAATGFAKVSAEAAPPPELKHHVQAQPPVQTVAWVAPQDRPALPSAEYVPADYAIDPGTADTAATTNPTPPADQSTNPAQTGVANNQADLFDHYVVQEGDTLTHIAAAYGISWQALWSANSDRLAHPDLLFVGEILRLPF